MPAKMVATLKVFDALGGLRSESSHTSFDSAWQQGAREFLASYDAATDGRDESENTDHWEDAWNDYKGALRGAPGQFQLTNPETEQPLSRYVITAYEPLS